MPGQTPGTRFAVRSGDLLWTEWPGEGCYSLFDPGTSLTHLISEVPAAILRKLTQGPLALVDLTTSLAAEQGLPMDAAWCSVVAQSIDGLMALELVEPRVTNA